MEIQARISERTLSKVTRLFNATLTDILNELLQNARRAGATRVKVEVVNENYLSITDDGVGIDDPQILLTLGNSDWEEETQHREDPAGMGIFSLANREVEIRSRDWFVNLTPANFTGELPAQVQPTELRVGTVVSFRLKEGEVFIKKVLDSVAKYYPSTVEFNGTLIEQKDFLQNALYIEEWRGLRMGVFDNYYPSLNVLNFYGINLSHNLPSIEQVNQYTRKLGVKIDIVDCPDIKLVLPARKELVENQFLLELYNEVRGVIYRYLSTLEFHQLPHSLWQQALALGLTLPEAKAELKEYQPEVADHYANNWNEKVPVTDNTLIISESVEPVEQQIFWREFEKAKLSYTPVRRQPQYEGYTWYDRIPVLSNIEFAIAIDGKQLTPEDAEAEYGNRDKVEVDDIVITTTLTQLDGTSEQITFSSDLYLCQDEDSDCLGDVTIYLKRGHKISVDELANLLEAAFFFPSDDVESDSYGTQQEYFQEAAYERAKETLLSSQEITMENLRSRLEEIRSLLPEGARADISLSPDNISIEIHQGE